MKQTWKGAICRGWAQETRSVPTEPAQKGGQHFLLKMLHEAPMPSKDLRPDILQFLDLEQAYAQQNDRPSIVSNFADCDGLKFEWIWAHMIPVV